MPQPALQVDASVTKTAQELAAIAFETAEHLLKVAREARLSFVVFRRDGQQPGEAAPLARALWMGIPELAACAGVPIDRETEGYPASIVPTDRAVRERLAVDVAGGREIAQWLDGHITPEMRQMFSPTFRDDNIVDKAMEANAAMNNDRRNDIFQHERLDGKVRNGREEHRMIAEREDRSVSPKVDAPAIAHLLARQGLSR